MSVLIKGMEMPKSCEECFVFYTDCGCNEADVFKPLQLRDMSKCPLVEIPTPHGDMISRKMLLEEIDSWVAMDSFERKYQESVREVAASFPSVEPERKKGHWVGIDDEPCDVFECDVCGTTYDTVDGAWDVPKYCPQCGAKMEDE